MESAARRAFFFLECADEATAQRIYLSALGLRTPIGRWDVLQAQISNDNHCSVDVAIPDFRGDHDLRLLCSHPGVRRVEEIMVPMTLPDPKTARIAAMQYAERPPAYAG